MASSNGDSPVPLATRSASFDHTQGPPRKKMRKGTRSCLECRRRKIRCTFEAGRTQICNECYARGSTCIDQEHGDVTALTQSTSTDTAYSLRERVSQLEDLVRQVLYKLPDKDDGKTSSARSPSRTTVDTQAAEVLKSLKSSMPNVAAEDVLQLPGGFREDAPALTLFDNAVIARRDKIPEITRAQYNKAKTLATALTQLLPTPHDLDIILDASSKWFDIWRQMFPEIADARCETIKEAVSHSLRSDRPAEIAKTMLCIAIGVQQMPPDFNWERLHLKDDPQDLMDRYIATIGQLVTSDDEIAASLEGIECMVLEGKYHANMGKPRRAWMLFRRAITFAQLLGLHRLSSRKPRSDETGHYQRQVSLWCHLFMGDRYMSLILGMPTMVDEVFTTPYIPPFDAEIPNVSLGELYAARMCPVVTKIVNRNQSPTPLPYSVTLRIDQELEELKERTPPELWIPSRLPGSSLREHFDRLQASFMHHQTRSILHMPFMLKSSSDKRYQYSHQAALESSREMIKYYKALRSEEDVGPYICKLIDFQAFTAAMLLLLNLCGYSQHVRGVAPQQPDLDQDQLDSTLIDDTIGILHAASKETGGIVASQAAKALEMLAMVRQGTCDEEADKYMQGSCQVSIPYFGTITLGMGKHFVPIKAGTYPDRGLSNGRTNSVPGVNPNSGLPTPPSLTSCSTQPSPMSSHLGADQIGPAGARGFYGAETNYIAPGLSGQQYGSSGPTDDSFVNFDSYMSLPPIDFPASAGGSATSNFSSGLGQQSSSGLPTGPVQVADGSYAAIDPSLGGTGLPGFDNNGFPWGMPANFMATAGGDLDNTWNWTGDLQW